MCVKMHVRLLTRLGAVCSAAYNGQEAVQTVEAAMQLDALAAGEARGGFDLVLMDNCMPVMDGPAACRQIRAAGASYPIVGLTGVFSLLLLLLWLLLFLLWLRAVRESRLIYSYPISSIL